MRFRTYASMIVTTVGLLLLGANGLAEAQTGQRFGTVYKITGVVVASNPGSGAAREIKQGDVLFVGEQIRSSATGEAVLRTDDAGVIAVRPNADFVMEKFSAKGKPDDQFSLRIVFGALRLITGWVGVVNKSGHRITTATATIGVRGTDHEPYVLSKELATQLGQAEGTYDKVSRGGTFLDTGGAKIDIDPGRVGFAPAPPAGRARALMTALLPVLLEKVPGFYVPGTFDAELEALASQELSKALKNLNITVPVSPAAVPLSDAVGVAPSPAATAVPTASESAGLPTQSESCNPQSIAEQWLGELDAAIVARNTDQFIAKFDPLVDVLARVKGPNGTTTVLRFSRDEMAKSTFTALSQLSEFTSRRPVILGKIAADTTLTACDRLDVDSVVIESGVRNGGAYRIESLETFLLELRWGRWLATQAVTKTGQTGE